MAYGEECDYQAGAFVYGTPGSEGQWKILKQSSQLAFGRVELQGSVVRDEPGSRESCWEDMRVI